MSLSSHFNEALHSIRQGLLLPLPAKAERKPRERAPRPYPDLEPSQRAFRIARRNKAIEIAEAVERKQKRKDLVRRFWG